MKHITFFLLLAYSLATQAQCDPAAYQEILTKAKDYQTQGDYIMAKNNYQAAIIFHCKPEEKEACEKAIDNLFESNAALLQKIKAANTSLVLLLVQLFEGFINEMNYDAMQDILEKSVEIDKKLNYVGRDSFTNEYLHLIYYHYEFGKQNQNNLHKQHIRKAIQLCKAMCLYRKEKDKSYISGDSLIYIHTTLAAMLSPYLEKKLHDRYYPNMITVKGATFEMRHAVYGSHQVSLSDYEIGQTEVTVQQYFLFCEVSGYDKPKETPSWGWKADNPIVNVNWADAAAYCNWITAQENIDNAVKNEPVYSINSKHEWEWQTGKDSLKKIVTTWENSKAYHLPSEAQWQFAAEGGIEGIKKNYMYAGSDSINEVAWYKENSESHTHPVGKKKENALQLYDMSGNVWEWCQDWYDGDYYEKAKNSYNPVNETAYSYKVLRGGSWINVVNYCHLSYRDSNYPNNSYNGTGFRVVR